MSDRVSNKKDGHKGARSGRTERRSRWLKNAKRRRQEMQWAHEKFLAGLRAASERKAAKKPTLVQKAKRLLRRLLPR